MRSIKTFLLIAVLAGTLPAENILWKLVTVGGKKYLRPATASWRVDSTYVGGAGLWVRTGGTVRTATTTDTVRAGMFLSDGKITSTGIILANNGHYEARTTDVNAGARNFSWGQTQAYGQWSLRISNLKDGDPVAAGTSLISATAAGTVFNSKLDVIGTARSTDTLRTGDWTTYSYIIPGGALVQSSDEALKTDIRSFNPDLSKFSLVNPKVFKFKRENFVKTFDETSVPDSVDKQIDSVTVRVSNKVEKDKRRAAFNAEAGAFADRMAEVKHTGLMATDFNPLIMGKNSKELNQGEVIAVLWKKVQELEARIKLLESR